VSTVHYNTRTAWGVQYREGLGFKCPVICSPHTKHSQLRTLPVTDPQLRPSSYGRPSYGPPVKDAHSPPSYRPRPSQLRPPVTAPSYGPPVTAPQLQTPRPPSYGPSSYGPPVTDSPVTDPQSYGHLYYPGSLKGPHISLKVGVKK
jgi:hypothetical protein